MLVLGSFPSAASIAASCYYAHPRNHFWPILSEAWGEPFPPELERRGEWALSRGVAIWDSLGACVRPGSLDGDIALAEPNRLAAFLCRWPLLERVLLNGRASERYFRRGLEEIALRDGETARTGRLRLPGGRTLGCFYLPSTSPVPSREFRRMEDKLPLWLQALKA
jgi:TDG/mug DNA glycosylase family protein